MTSTQCCFVKIIFKISRFSRSVFCKSKQRISKALSHYFVVYLLRGRGMVVSEIDRSMYIVYPCRISFIIFWHPILVFVRIAVLHQVINQYYFQDVYISCASFLCFSLEKPLHSNLQQCRRQATKLACNLHPNRVLAFYPSSLFLFF
jgi:hypothetical protein